ncbi:hypothetical protein HDU67_005843 [Dinochytrium kinnereticum]|nr:hypothetical protein HDU67_005843 [Dinochytrium kinnereticum]
MPPHSRIEEATLKSILSTGKLTPEVEAMLGKLASEAKNGSYSPYSKFRVGASLLSTNGNVWMGANVENASYGIYPSFHLESFPLPISATRGAICAERTSFAKAVSEGDRKFLAVGVATDVDEFISPCGFCRQFMVEFGKGLNVYLFKSDGTFKLYKLHELIPDSFGPDDLELPRDSQ